MVYCDINNKMPDMKYSAKIRIYNSLVKNINDKNPPNKYVDDLDLPVYFTPLYTDFFLCKHYQKKLYKFFNSINKDMVLASRNIISITYIDHYLKNDKLFKRNKIGVFNFNYLNLKNNGIITGKD